MDPHPSGSASLEALDFVKEHADFQLWSTLLQFLEGAFDYRQPWQRVYLMILSPFLLVRICQVFDVRRIREAH